MIEVLIAVVLVWAAVTLFLPNDAKEVYARLAAKKKKRTDPMIEKLAREWFDAQQEER